MSKKTLAVGIVFLFIFSVGNSLVVGYDVEIEGNPSEGDFLTECLNEHEELTHHNHICGKNCDSEPCTWTWDTRTLFKHRHIIEIVAYGRFGSSTGNELTVWRFF